MLELDNCRYDDKEVLLVSLLSFSGWRTSRFMEGYRDGMLQICFPRVRLMMSIHAEW